MFGLALPGRATPGAGIGAWLAQRRPPSRTAVLLIALSRELLLQSRARRSRPLASSRARRSTATSRQIASGAAGRRASGRPPVALGARPADRVCSPRQPAARRHRALARARPGAGRRCAAGGRRRSAPRHQRSARLRLRRRGPAPDRTPADRPLTGGRWSAARIGGDRFALLCRAPSDAGRRADCRRGDRGARPPVLHRRLRAHLVRAWRCSAVPRARQPASSI